jgi:hypothetical protein
MVPEFHVTPDRPPRGPFSHTARCSVRRRGGHKARTIGAGTTVWPCGEDWLTTAVATITTTYTQPGDRVLLHRPDDQPAARTPNAHMSPGEAIWTMLRLGRSVAADPAEHPDGDDLTLVLTVIHSDRPAIPDLRLVRQQLKPGGVLAAISHTDEVDGHSRDRSGEFIRAARSAGLKYHDHIVLLRPDGQHGDLMVFAKEPSDA